MVESKLYRARDRGQRAEALLSNELLAESFNTLEADYVRAWRESEPSEHAARETYWKAVQILTDVRNHLVKVANNGKLAQRELDDMAARFNDWRAA